MDKEQLSRRTEELNAQYLDNIADVQIIDRKPNFTETKDGKIGDILEQRHAQRNRLFWFSIGFVTVTTLFVLILIGLQAYLNFHGYKVKLIEATTLQIIVTGIFVQFVGLVGIITRSIWDDKPYLEAGVIKERKKF